MRYREHSKKLDTKAWAAAAGWCLVYKTPRSKHYFSIYYFRIRQPNSKYRKMLFMGSKYEDKHIKNREDVRPIKLGASWN